MGIGGFDFLLLKFVIDKNGVKFGDKKLESTALLMQHLNDLVTPVALQLKGPDDNSAAANADQAILNDIKGQPTPYKLPDYPLEKKVSKKPVGAIGQKAYMYCHNAEDRDSGICVKTADSGTLKRCRPSDGFAEGKACWYERDCDQTKRLFCYHAQTLEAVCAKELPDYGSCVRDSQCKSRKCALSFGLACHDDDKNCLCAPRAGLKAGSKSADADNCESGKVTTDNGVNTCQ